MKTNEILYVIMDHERKFLLEDCQSFGYRDDGIEIFDDYDVADKMRIGVSIDMITAGLWPELEIVELDL